MPAWLQSSWQRVDEAATPEAFDEALATGFDHATRQSQSPAAWMATRILVMLVASCAADAIGQLIAPRLEPVPPATGAASEATGTSGGPAPVRFDGLVLPHGAAGVKLPGDLLPSSRRPRDKAYS
ncbi:MAG: hypothetical protein ACKVOX_06400 [Rhizobacter sp.]